MRARRSHCKSRTGCLQCKARRTKCDENKPRCAKCIKRNDSCSLEASSSLLIIPTSYRGAPRPAASSASSSTTFTFSNMAFPGHIPLQIHGESAESRSGLWFDAIPQQHDQDGTLRLMQHCAMYCSLSSADLPDMTPAWQSLVTQLAFKHEFLLHAIVSLTSIHLALLRPSSTHLRMAIKHHSVAIRLAVTQLATITESNASALGVFSRILPLYSRGFCQATSYDPIRQSCDDFKLIQGLTALGGNAGKWMDPLLKNEFLFPPLLDCAPLPKEIEDNIATISRRNLANSQDIELRKSVSAAISLVRYSLQLYHQGVDQITICAPFAMHIPQKFVQALEDREPIALVVLSYYAVVTHSLRKSVWMHGMGKAVVEAIAKALPMEWQDCLEWPLREVQI